MPFSMTSNTMILPYNGQMEKQILFFMIIILQKCIRKRLGPVGTQQ